MATSFCFKIGFVHTKGEEGDTWKEMAQKERVMPNCVYACNPYHECTEFCLQKSKDTKPTKTKKGADYRRSVTDDDLGKKVNGEKHTHTGCPKASNPYHVCNEHCNKRMSGADSGTLPLGRRKKPGPKPELPILDSVPASKIGAIYLSDASSPLSKYSEVKKVEPKQSEIIPVSGEIHIQDIKLVNRKVLPNKDDAEYVAANPIGIKHEGDKNSSTKVVPIPNVYGTGGFITSAVGSMDFNSSDISNDNDESDGEETGSMVSESRVPVGSYHVKESFVPILMSIFNKHGDIGASCHLESVVMRSYYIECVCFVVQELQSTSILHLTKSNVKELLAILKDVESAQLNVAWLRSILDGIAENIDFINQHRAAEVAKANHDQEIEQLRKVLDSELGSLVQKEQEVTDTKTRIEEIKERLDQLALKSSDLDKNLLYIKSKVDKSDSKSILNELF